MGHWKKSPLSVGFLLVILLFQTATFGGIPNVNAESVEIPEDKIC